MFYFQTTCATYITVHLLVGTLSSLSAITLFQRCLLSSLQGVSNGWASQIFPPGYFSIETSLYSAQKSGAYVWLILVFPFLALSFLSSSLHLSLFISHSIFLFHSSLPHRCFHMQNGYCELVDISLMHAQTASLSRSLVLSLPRAAEVRTLTLQQSDNIPPSDNAINEAEFTYNTQHAALRFSARRGVRRAKRAPALKRLSSGTAIRAISD